MLVRKNIYSDLPLFMSKNPFTGDLAIKKDQNAVNEALRNVILTTIGERPFESTFGTTVYDCLFEHPAFIGFYFESTTRLGINTNEKRATIEKIDYDVNEKEINISIEFRIASLNIRETVRLTLQRTR